MTNPYFSAPTAIGARTRAQAAQVNDLATAVENAFDLLPSPESLNGSLLNFGVTTGTGSDYILNLNPPVTALAEGVKVSFRASHTNTGDARLKVNALDYVPLRDRGGAVLPAGGIQSGFYYEVRFVGNSWRIQSTVESAVTGDYYRRTNIIGAVSQASGVPTGALIEKGTNSFGTWRKHACGFMRCTRTVTLNLNTNVVQSFTGPQVFIENGALTGGFGVRTSLSGTGFLERHTALTATVCRTVAGGWELRILTTAVTAATMDIALWATGEWF